MRLCASLIKLDLRISEPFKEWQSGYVSLDCEQFKIPKSFYKYIKCEFKDSKGNSFRVVLMMDYN